MARNQQVVRQWLLLAHMESSPGGVCISRFARAHGITPRSVYRDLEALQQAGFPIFNDRAAGHSLWRLTDAWRRRGGPPLDTTELLALCCARGVLETLDGVPFQQALRSLMAKLDAQLTPQMRALAHRLERAFVGDPFGRPRVTAPPGLLEKLREAITLSVTLELLYRNQRGEESRRRVDPYNIWYHRGALYLIARCHRRSEILTFALSRIQDATLTTDPFTGDPAYSFGDFVGQRFRIMADGRPTRVRIRFTQNLATYIQERTWHPSQRLRVNPDGTLELTMKADGLSEIRAWVLSFGPQARVLEPTALAARVRDDLIRAAAAYGDGEEK